MTDWRTAMRSAAEQDEHDRLSADQADTMRRVIVAAVVDDASARARTVWMRRPVLVAATIVAVVSIGVGTGIHLDLSSRSEHAATAGDAPAAAFLDQTDHTRVVPQNRQLQFLTPGGTRIIWVFNQDLDLKATLR
jgi:hypothetical protein